MVACWPQLVTPSRFAMLRERVLDVVNQLLQKCRLPTREMINNLLHIELAYVNTNHPDFVGGGGAINSVFQKMAQNHLLEQQQQQMLQQQQLQQQQQQMLQQQGQPPQLPPQPQAAVWSTTVTQVDLTFSLLPTLPRTQERRRPHRHRPCPPDSPLSQRWETLKRHLLNLAQTAFSICFLVSTMPFVSLID